MDNSYYCVHLKDGSVLDLDKKCNKVYFGEPEFCICEHTMDKDKFETLLMIPYENINYIRKVFEE